MAYTKNTTALAVLGAVALLAASVNRAVAGPVTGPDPDLSGISLIGQSSPDFVVTIEDVDSGAPLGQLTLSTVSTSDSSAYFVTGGTGSISLSSSLVLDLSVVDSGFGVQTTPDFKYDNLLYVAQNTPAVDVGGLLLQDKSGTKWNFWFGNEPLNNSYTGYLLSADSKSVHVADSITPVPLPKSAEAGFGMLAGLALLLGWRTRAQRQMTASGLSLA